MFKSNTIANKVSFEICLISMTAFKGVFGRFKRLFKKSGINIPPSIRKAVKSPENALKRGLLSIH